MQAIILCGGKGGRLRPLTNSTPKPLVKVGGLPIVCHIINHLKFHNIVEHILVTGYKSKKFLDFFNTSNNRPLIIDTGDQDIIERIKAVENEIFGDFIVLYGDTVSNLDISKLVSFHHSHNNLATMSIWPLKTQFGLVEVDELDSVIGFEEKPTLDKWINIGYFCFKKEIFQYLKDYKSFADFLYAITSKQLLKAYRHEGIHLTINTLQELENAEDEISSIYSDRIAQ